MKKFKHAKVLLCAGAIILVCVAALVICIHFVFGMEEDKVIAEQPGTVLTTKGAVQTVSALSDAQYITKEEAVDIFSDTVKDIFNQTADTDTMSAMLEKEPTHASWLITTDTFVCSIDAASGDVIHCYIHSDYSGKSYPLGQLEKDQYYKDLRDDPDNIYIQTAEDIINSRLADGRAIDHIEIDGIGFILTNESSVDIDTPAMAIVEVDCYIYMETGPSYHLIFRGGSDMLEVYDFSTHPTWQACEWYYYYEEDAVDPYSEWQTAPNITEGTYTVEGGRPTAVPASTPNN